MLQSMGSQRVGHVTVTGQQESLVSLPVPLTETGKSLAGH